MEKMEYAGKYPNAFNEESESMTLEEMEELQRAVDNSKQTAFVEEQKREFNRQSAEIEKLFDGGKSTQAAENLKEKPSTSKQGIKQHRKVSTGKDAKSKREFRLTFHNSVKTSYKSLDIVHHEPVFPLPITTNPEYENYTTQQKAQLLSLYFTKIGNLQLKLAKESVLRAPYSKPILPSKQYKNSLLDEVENADEIVEDLPVEDLYISRAGRQIKRKIYTEENEGTNDSDFIYISKKNKSDDSDLKITWDSFDLPSEIETEKITKGAKNKKENSKQQNKKNDLVGQNDNKKIDDLDEFEKMLDNQITKTNRIPVGSRKPLRRCESMFDKLKQEEEKKKQQEEEIELFEKSLKLDDEDFLDASPTKANDENLPRVRVPPTLPIKKGNTKKIKQKEAVAKNGTRSESPILRRFINEKPGKSSEVNSDENNAKLEKVPCPICNRVFPQTEIEDHASTCGMDVDVLGTSSTTTRHTCELCDKTFLVSRDYLTHVKSCIAANISEV